MFYALFLVAVFPLIITASQQCPNSGSDYGFALIGHVYESFKAARLATCYSACNTEPACQSLNFNLADNTCQFNSERRASRPDRYVEKQHHVYADNPDRGLVGSIRQRPGSSCKHIAQSGDSRGDGEYWVDPQGNGNPFRAFCDMTTDGGGWLLVANFVMESSTAPPDWTAEKTYRGITNYHNNRMGITMSAMKKLREHVPFTQLRFHCSKQQGNTFHVTTVTNSNGEAVVQYFSDQTDVRPDSCNSFTRLDGDTSKLATKCNKWSTDGKWGHKNKKGERQMYDHTAFVVNKNHWHIVNGVWHCDDSSRSVSAGDFWKVYVR